MVLGAIGVAMSMHAHLEQRMDVLAILKAIGAGSTDLLRIFLLQTMGLGFAGALIGVAAGVGVEIALPAVFGNLLPVHAVLAFPWRSALAGLATGLLTTLLFCLPPLLDVRKVRPILVFRRMVEQAQARPWSAAAILDKLKQNWLQIVCAFFTLLALGGIAAALSDSAEVGGYFAAALAAILFVILGLSAGFLRFLRWLLKLVRLHLPQFLRQGLANLYRPGNQSAAVLAALGTGVMLILAVYLMQAQVLREIAETASPTLPNIFLVDITSDEVAGVKQFFSQAARRHSATRSPTRRQRPLPLDQRRPPRQAQGRTLSQAHARKRFTQLGRRTTAPAIACKKAIGGTTPTPHEIALSEGIADRIHVSIGAAIDVEVDGKTLPVKVAAIFKADEQHIASRTSFIMPSGLLKDAPTVWYGAARVDIKQVSAVERALFNSYPTVTVINLADVLDRIESVVRQITFVVRFLAGFSIFAGLMILASSIASTRFRRTREAVVLKTLGATRGRIIRIFSVEFSVLGLLAGAVGVVFANLLTRILLVKLEAHWHMEWTATLVALVGTAVLATATGWIASYRILGLRPLEVLREE